MSIFYKANQANFFRFTGEDSSIHTLYDDLCNTLGQSAMQEILHTVDDTFSHEFYERYLHDFVCSLSLDIKDFENSTKVHTFSAFIVVKMETVFVCSIQQGLCFFFYQ